MSSKLIDPNSALQRLKDDGYQVDVREQHILLYGVPYVTSNRTVAKGTLICTYVENAGSVLPPDNHQVWWTGEYPCFANGLPIEQIRNEDGERELFPGCSIRHRFSNKPDGATGFTNHYAKLLHYCTLLQAQAKAVDSSIDARGNIPESQNENLPSPFVYADSASALAEIQSTQRRLAMKRIAILGVGGTGAYIFDQLVKTPVAEIHIFDGDVFLQHNAFRAPGAASQDDFAEKPYKVDYFKRKYEVMQDRKSTR